MERIVLEVLPEDINSGVRMKSTTCAISQALARQLGGRWSTSSFASTKLGGPPWPVYASVDPARFQQFVRDFDYGRPVLPTTFTLLRRSV